MNNLRKLMNNSFLQGTVLLTVANFILSFFNYFFNIIVARSLGPQAFGDLTAMFSYMVILSVPVTVVTTLVIQKISSAGDNRFTYAQMLNNWLIQKLKRWWFLGFILLCASPFVPGFTNLSPLTGNILLLLLIITFLTSFYDAAFQGLHFFITFTIISLATAVLKLSGAILASLQIGGIYSVTTFILISIIFKYIVSIYFFRSHTTENKSTHILEKRIVNILRKDIFWITSLSVLGISLLNNADIVYAKKFFTDYDAGIYSSWSLFAKIVFYVTGPLLNMTLIFFADNKKERHGTVLKLLISGLILLGVGSFIVYQFFGNLVVSIFFGERFIRVIPILGKAAIFGSLYLFIAFVNQYFLAKRSRNALILPSLIPIYIFSLLLIHPSLENLININIMFACIVITSFAVTSLMKEKLIS